MTVEFRLATGARARHLGAVDSTNAEALRLAAAGERGPLWLWADVQVHGRGRQGRRWESEAGNLYASLLVAFDVRPGEAASISLAAPLAVVATLNGFLSEGVKARLKWPNDVLVQGRKVAGVLVESFMAGPAERFVFVIGCGLNLRHAPLRSRYGATSLYEHGAGVSPLAALEVLAHQMEVALALWDRGAGIAAVRAAWISHAEGIGRKMVVARGREALAGTFEGLALSGALRLRLGDGQIAEIDAGEVLSVDHSPETAV